MGPSNKIFEADLHKRASPPFSAAQKVEMQWKWGQPLEMGSALELGHFKLYHSLRSKG